jgi:hypothetical protein
MAEIRYNIGDLFQQEFGVRPVIPFKLPSKSEVPPNINLTGISTVQMTKHGVISALGTPVMFPVWFKGGNYNKYKRNGELVTVSINNDLLLPFTTMVDFSREKMVTETPAATGYGTVKETWAVDDWKVRIRGFILSEETGKFNQRAIEDLLRFEELVDVIGVQGTMFNLLDIQQILIKRIALPKTEGRPNVQPFIIEAKSDVPVQLII